MARVGSSPKRRWLQYGLVGPVSCELPVRRAVVVRSRPMVVSVNLLVGMFRHRQLSSRRRRTSDERSEESVPDDLVFLLCREFSLLLARHDPARLTHYGAPDDEYDSEAREIVRHA